MLISCWSVKGGSGTTVVTVALALALARAPHTDVLVADLAGDVPAVLGVAEPHGPGLAGWLGAGPSVPADALARLEHDAGRGVALLPLGEPGTAPEAGPAPPVDDRMAVLARLLGADPRPVVVDCGVLGVGTPASILASAASPSLLVIRPCYLALRRAAAAPLRPTGVVLVAESGRVLGRSEVEQVVGAPVVAVVACDPAVARAVDAGLLGSRLPRSLDRALRPALAVVAA